ncbi:hypothetical protein F7725_005258 [Dissostichus mawsoni]|uniref:Uncharacterized protein n=1 Tax=Dissostichus mawsoni TaxID=36200 RepID=A0A7J5YRW7_DISMA|nr:hypothetical protein F7725_005258 [Dissostichus mawsoni]
MASSTQPTVPSPPHTSTRTLPGGSRVHSCRALEGFSSDRLPAAQLVDLVQVVRRDDEAVELSQLTLVCIRQAGHAVIVHRVLTPHTPRGRRTQSHQKRQEMTQKSCGGSRTLNKSFMCVFRLERCALHHSVMMTGTMTAREVQKSSVHSSREPQSSGTSSPSLYIAACR